MMFVLMLYNPVKGCFVSLYMPLAGGRTLLTTQSTFFQSCQYFLFVCFVALCPKSTAMAVAGQSVHLTTHFPGQA